MLDADHELGALDLFAGVDPVLVGTPRKRHWVTGDAIIVEGNDPRGLVLLTKGAAEVSLYGQVVADRQAVSLLGEQALIEGNQHSANVVARGSVETLEWSGEATNALFNDPAFLRNLARELSRKLRQSTNERARRYRNEELLLPTLRAHASERLVNELLERGIDSTPTITDAAILFVDIVGFTRQASAVAPSDLAEQLGAFLSMAVDVVHAHDGIVDKFIGDAVMAVWAYEDGPTNTRRALAAARAISARAPDLRLGDEAIAVTAGLEAGLCFLGTVGNDTKRQFTALGPVVNRAARLQGKAGEIGAVLVVGPGAIERLGDDLGDLEAHEPIALKNLESTPAWIVRRNQKEY